MHAKIALRPHVATPTAIFMVHPPNVIQDAQKHQNLNLWLYLSRGFNASLAKQFPVPWSAKEGNDRSPAKAREMTGAPIVAEADGGPECLTQAMNAKNFASMVFKAGRLCGLGRSQRRRYPPA